jgi:hypothetical protein
VTLLLALDGGTDRVVHPSGLVVVHRHGPGLHPVSEDRPVSATIDLVQSAPGSVVVQDMCKG